jgi:hypothetical protein
MAAAGLLAPACEAAADWFPPVGMAAEELLAPAREAAEELLAPAREATAATRVSLPVHRPSFLLPSAWYDPAAAGARGRARPRLP